LRANLNEKIASQIRELLARGELKPGDRLPTEQALCVAHGVSRTVVREAIAALKADGLVVARQGSGVFVAKKPEQPFGLSLLAAIEPEKISSIIETLELRAALESEAAALAAERWSPAELAKIQECFDAASNAVAAGEQGEDQDFAFHLAIAEATHNRHFVEFFRFLGQRTIPRGQLRGGGATAPYLEQIQQEHRSIVDAISERNISEAHASMRAHLKSSQERYQKIYRAEN
jgi:GntR family transcriptional regulator, transcriptional repressor for pyruvate dehydrogenase complex